jgi:aminoacyl tRNA synthase complex-interacting multifunctional protein 1
MSSSGAISKLPSPLRELVLASVQEDAKAVGSSEKDKAEVEAWIEKVAAGEVTAESLKVCTLML